eukprot:403356188
MRCDQLKHEADVSPAEMYEKLLEDEPTQTYLQFRESLAHPDIMNYKKILIDWLFEVGQRFYQSNLTIHIAIAYLERAYQNNLHQTKDGKLKSESGLRLLAITCLLLASKYDELDDKIPFIIDLSKVLKKVVNINHSEVLRLETEILFSFNFELMIVTPLHFVQSILSQGCVFEYSDHLTSKESTIQKSKRDSSINLKEKKQITNKVLDNLRKYAEFFADLSTHIYDLKKFNCSQVGLACILAARNVVNISPMWNPHLRALCNIEYKDTEKPFKILFMFYKQCFQQGSPVSQKENQISQPQKQHHQNINQISQIALTLDLSTTNNYSQSIENFTETYNNILTQKRPSSKIAINPIKVSLIEYDSKPLGIQTTRQSDINGNKPSKINLITYNKTISANNPQIKPKSGTGQPKAKIQRSKLQKEQQQNENKRNVIKNSNLCNSMLNFTNYSKENLENLDPTKCEMIVAQTKDYHQKPQSQIRKIGDQIVLSSAYSTASNIANISQNQNTLKEHKNLCKSLEPVLKQKNMNQSSIKLIDNNHQAFLFNPKQEYFGQQPKQEYKSKLTLSKSSSPSKIKAEILQTITGQGNSNNNSKSKKVKTSRGLNESSSKQLSQNKIISKGVEFLVMNDRHGNVQPSKKKELVQSLLSQSHSLGNLFTIQNQLGKQKSSKTLLSQLVQPSVSTSTSISNLQQYLPNSSTARRQSQQKSGLLSQQSFSQMQTMSYNNRGISQRGRKDFSQKRAQQLQNSNIIAFKDRSDSQIDVNTTRKQPTLNESASKDIMNQIMQNKLELNKKSKSVESLVNLSGLNQRRAIINQLASKMVKGREIPNTNQQQLDSFRKLAGNESSILASQDFTYQSQNMTSRQNFGNHNYTQMSLMLNSSNFMNQNQQTLQQQILNAKKQDSQKKKAKAPQLNPQAIDATKKRILNILNTKLSKKLAQQNISQIQNSLNKCNSSTYIGNQTLNQSTMFSLKTHSARDQNLFVPPSMQFPNQTGSSASQKVTANCTARHSLAAAVTQANSSSHTTNSRPILQPNVDFNAYSLVNSSEQGLNIQTSVVQLNNSNQQFSIPVMNQSHQQYQPSKLKFEKRLSMQRMNQNHTIQCNKGFGGTGGALTQCPSTSYLFVVDEEEKIQQITNSLNLLQKQKSSASTTNLHQAAAYQVQNYKRLIAHQ